MGSLKAGPIPNDGGALLRPSPQAQAPAQWSAGGRHLLGGAGHPQAGGEAQEPTSGTVWQSGERRPQEDVAGR